MWCWLTLTVCVLHLDTPVTFAHPQCLDASPPSSASAPLTLCSEYTEFGCCSPRQEKTILDKYEHVRHRATDRDWQRCSGYVRDLLCQVCSPLSAHLYEADGRGTVRPLPGLCPYYSRRFYGLCGSLLWFLDPDLAPLVQSEEDFGQKTEIADMAYCYPDVLNRTESEGEAEEHVDQEAAGSSPDGCLCLEPVATGVSWITPFMPTFLLKFLGVRAMSIYLKIIYCSFFLSLGLAFKDLNYIHVIFFFF